MTNIATLFSGIGTPEIALKELGVDFNTVFACEIDKYAKKTYFANHKIDLKDFHEDVASFNAKKYKNKIDILITGSPCQPFSIAGAKKGFDDKRGKLFFEMIKRIKECNPETIIFENVKNILTHDKGETFKIVLDEFKKLGYDYIDYKILNALDFRGVQRRERLYLVASKSKLFSLKNLPKSKNSKPFEELLETNIDPKYWIQSKSRRYLDDEIKTSKTCKENRWIFGYHLDTENLHTPTITANLSVGVPNNVLIDREMCKYNLWTCDFASSDMCNYCNDYAENYQHNYNPTPAVRRLTPREAARFQSIPDSFSFPVSDTQAYKEIGNSMEINTLKSIFAYILEKEAGEELRRCA